MCFRFQFVLCLCALALNLLPLSAQAGVQWRPAIGGYQVGNVYPTGKTYMYSSADAAGAARCVPRPGTTLTGRYRLDFPLGSPHPSYVADCEVRLTPDGVEPAKYGFPGSSNGYNLFYSTACKNGGQMDTRTQTCAVPDGRPPQPDSCGSGQGANEHGNPIDFSTGQKLRREPDYQGAHGLNFTRQYMSNPLFDGFAPHWRHNFDKRMFSNLFLPQNAPLEATWVLNPDNTWGNGRFNPAGSAGPASFASFPLQDIGLGTAEAYFTRDDGYVLYFTSTDQGKTWATDGDVNYKLSGLPFDANWPKGRWQLETPTNDKEIFDGGNGALLEIRYRDGRVHTLNYTMVDGKPGNLAQVTDNFGRSLKFTWGGDNVIAKMTDPDGQDFLYGYDNHNLLTSVTYPDGLSRLYHYDEPAFATPVKLTVVDGLLTGISDEVTSGSMVRWGTFKYNTKGLAVSTELAGSAEKYQFDYEASTVTDPLGTTRVYGFQNLGGVKLQRSISQPAGAGCDPATMQKSYDADANLLRSTDYNGVVTAYTYYPGNLIKSKTQGVGTDQQRTTTWEWHPVFRQPTKIAAPKLLTLFEYDANGNLTAITEQATLDATGAQGLTPSVTGPVRKTSATYSAVGQVLTETTFKDGIEQITRYQYNPLDGNLESMTTPDSQVTRLSRYNAHGDPGRIEAPSGQTADLTYYPRRWLKSVTQNGSDGDSLTTNYEYDSRGRKLRETRPNGGIKIYNIDAAGRLTNIADNIDNSIDFTLDAMGNRLLEQVRDVNGVLIDETRRTVDPLGRLQNAVSGKTAPVQDVPSTTTLSSTDNPVRVGYPLRVTATVAGSTAGVSGEVVCMEGQNRLAVQFLHDGKATLDISNLALGNHTLTAFYSGDNKNHPSTSGQLIQVIQAGSASTIILTCPALSTVESTLTCTASISTDAAYLNRLSGQPLKLREGNAILATGVLQVKDGAATTQLSMTGLPMGSHQFQAFYAGDAVLLPNQSGIAAHTVQPHAPQITRLSLTGPLDVGAMYDVSLPGLGNGSGGYATYTVTASDTSLMDVARHLAASVQAVTACQVKANGATLLITGPDKVAFTVNANVYNRPALSEGDFFQQALAPRPGTSARLKMDLGLGGWGTDSRSTGDYRFVINIDRYAPNHEFLEHRSAIYLDNKRPINNSAVLDDLCASFAATFPGMQCLRFSDTSARSAFVDMPLGQAGWEISGMFQDNVSTINLNTSIVTAGESTILVPQPQIISVRPLGKVYSGAVYSITAGTETWHYTSSAQDTEASILNGLAAAVAQSQQYVASVVTARYGILNLQIASQTPVLPFTYSLSTSGYPVTIDATLVQAAR